MPETIQTKHDLCTGCNRCIRECPMETANITHQDDAGNIKVKIDHDQCITCGRCLSACKHGARVYEDDTLRFFHDLENGVDISLITAPSIRTNIPDWMNLFTCLKKLGVKQIYDVSLGADICIWGHVRHIERNKPATMITQPCPVIVTYCETHRQDLLERLSPVHSPMACLCVYMKEYKGVTGRIAALSPCVAKADEFESTGLAQYNITFERLLEYIKTHNIKLPDEQTDFDHEESGLGSVFPVPGGLKENIAFFLGNTVSIDKAEGASVFDMLDEYSQSPAEHLPQVYDVLNCQEGCNMGTACSPDVNIFQINRIMDSRRKMVVGSPEEEYFQDTLRQYDEAFDLTNFMRVYKPAASISPPISEEEIEQAFALLDKDTEEKRSLDCGACGSETCRGMARKIALKVNVPTNCITKAMEDAKKEHAQNLFAHEQLANIEKAREADERMQVILEANPHINILFDSSFNAIDLNPAAIEFLGYASKEEALAGFLGKIVQSIPPFQSNGKPSVPIAERLAAAIRDGFVKFETEVILDGYMRNLNVEFIKIPYEGSFGVVAYVFDMTDVHKRELDLIRAREMNELQLTKLGLIIHASKIALWDMEVVTEDPVSPENTLTWSQELRDMLGFSDENDFPNTIFALAERFHPDDSEYAFAAFAAHFFDHTGKTPYDTDFRLQKKNGDYNYFHATGETIRDENGIPLRVAGALVDITETKNILFDTEKHRVEAEAASKAKSAFLSTMSHEIRTPMNAILGITEIQLQNELLEPGVREGLEKIYTSGDLLLGIINDILDLSKIEAGKLELIPAQYEIASLISDTAQLNMMRIGSKLIDFEVTADENLPVLMLGDELRVKQILNNLLSNAFKYTAEGTVRLLVSVKDGGADDNVLLVIGVSDTGQGMSKEQVSRLFDEYSRFNLEANRTTEGTGLGMSITRNLIQMMNGEIFIESEPGKGSTFTVTLPQGLIGTDVIGAEMAGNLQKFRTNSRAQMRRVQITRDPMPYGHVLIVDDVETNIFVAKGLISPYGIKSDSAGSGFEAIEKVKNGKVYDIIFMDHMMPKMDGIEATKLIRSMGYEHPIVALTANAVAGQADIFLGNGFDDFISKPIDIRQLNTILNKLIRDKQPPEVIEEARKQAEARNEQNGEPNPSLDPEFAKIFIRDADKSLEAMEEIIKDGSYGEEHLRTYVIHTHGMKSALANIGNMSLSAAALKLEQSGRDGNVEVVTADTPAFIASLRAFIEEITPVEENTDAADEDTAYLQERLRAVLSACEEYDNNTAEDLIADLKKKPWSHETRELLEKLSEMLLHSDFDEAVETIKKLP
ncbi:MAG: ATP-binding protein [Oscillospiraceae bacterium]|nr:ATP-binding protein [Oscillospiraceae bacterium]